MQWIIYFFALIGFGFTISLTLILILATMNVYIEKYKEILSLKRQVKDFNDDFELALKDDGFGKV